MMQASVVVGSLVVGMAVALWGVVEIAAPPPAVTAPPHRSWARRITLRAFAPGIRVGPVGWDFSKSWATNVTVLGAALTALLGSHVVAAPKLVPDGGYALLSVLFAALVAVAPLTFRALSTQSRVLTPEGTTDFQFQGSAGGFLMSVILTTWGSVGQVATIIALVLEVLVSGSPQPFVSIPLLVLLLGVIAVLIAYVRSTVGPLLDHQSRVDEHRSGLAAQMRGLGIGGEPDFDRADAPLPGWRVL